MENKGLTFDLTLVQVFQGTLSGGLDKGWNYGGREDININLDTQKMEALAWRISQRRRRRQVR